MGRCSCRRPAGRSQPTSSSSVVGCTGGCSLRFRQAPVGDNNSVAKTPVILQSEASECGLACLALVLGGFGQSWSIGDLRERFSTSSRGVTLRRLLDISRNLSLIARPLRVELEYASQLQLPCILHWGLMHYVVLVAVHRDSFVIHDPAVG